MIRKIARALAGPLQLIPRPCWPHKWDDISCLPAACTRCGKTGWPLAALHDVFDSGD